MDSTNKQHPPQDSSEQPGKQPFARIKVIGVGGLAPGEERKVDLSVEIFDPPAA